MTIRLFTSIHTYIHKHKYCKHLQKNKIGSKLDTRKSVALVKETPGDITKSKVSTIRMPTRKCDRATQTCADLVERLDSETQTGSIPPLGKSATVEVKKRIWIAVHKSRHSAHRLSRTISAGSRREGARKRN